MFQFDINDKKYSHVHFIGIGGISMSGLALILLDKGYNVSGSDMTKSSITDYLLQKGAQIYIGHNDENVKNCDLVVYTSAISADNPEYIKAISNNIDTVDRATFLGQLMKKYTNSIAVAGTHGKTSTTGMISTILNKSTINPTILLGGELSNIGGNVKIGNGDLLITEACEYKGNFLKFFPTIGVVLNIEEDHLDYFKDINHIIDTFKDFAKLIPSEGYLIINSDDKYYSKITNNIICDVVTFGINNECDFKATNITFDELGLPSYDLIVNSNTFKVNLNVYGIHNVYNSLGAIAACNKAGLTIEETIEFIEDFKGTNRRFQYIGSLDDIKIVDEYAHHPTEIRATLSSAKNIFKGNIWVVFQPHTYTRTKFLLNEFSTSFNDANNIIITDIYAAREKDTGDIHSRDLVNKLKLNGIDSIYISDFDDIAKYLLKKATSNDLIITMGAGDVYKIGDVLLKNYKKMV